MIQNKLLRMILLQRILNKIITFIKPKGGKQYICCFLQYQILKAQEHINDGEWCDHVNQFILEPANSYCNFHILFIYYVLYFPLCTSHSTSIFPFLFYWSHLKVGAVPSKDSPLFRKSLTIGQLNVQSATAENEEQYFWVT